MLSHRMQVDARYVPRGKVHGKELTQHRLNESIHKLWSKKEHLVQEKETLLQSKKVHSAKLMKMKAAVNKILLLESYISEKSSISHQELRMTEQRLSELYQKQCSLRNSLSAEHSLSKTDRMISVVTKLLLEWNALVLEISTVLKDANLGANPIIIGHSFGGLMTMRFAAYHGEEVAGVVIVDSPVLPESEKSSAAPRRALSMSRHYPTFEIGLGRFRLLPAQECKNQFIVEFIARHSLRETTSGWTWKFDVAAMGSKRWAEPFAEHLHNMKCRSALIVAENSAIVSKVTAQYMSDLMGSESPMITIKDSHHHIMLDQPFRFIQAVKKILSNWDSIEEDQK